MSKPAINYHIINSTTIHAFVNEESCIGKYDITRDTPARSMSFIVTKLSRKSGGGGK